MESSQASLPLEMALYFNGYYSAALFVVTLLMFIYKAVMLPYPPSALGLEVAFVFLYGIVEWVRLRQGALLRGAGGGGACWGHFQAALCARVVRAPRLRLSLPPHRKHRPPRTQRRGATGWRARARCSSRCCSAPPL